MSRIRASGLGNHLLLNTQWRFSTKALVSHMWNMEEPIDDLKSLNIAKQMEHF
jgi:hypothetical protein